MKETEASMQLALTAMGNLFDFRRYACVPNISWALLEHGEADLVCLSKAGVFHEVEIKVSKSDLRADVRKPHGHCNKLIAYTWFAVPTELESVAVAELDVRFGIVVVEKHATKGIPITRIVRRPKRYKDCWARNPTPAEIERFLRCGVMRMWSRRSGEK